MSIWFEELILQDADFSQVNSNFPILLQIYKLNVRLRQKNKRQERQTGRKGRRERGRERKKGWMNKQGTRNAQERLEEKVYLLQDGLFY